MNWKAMSEKERLQFCDDHKQELYGIRTAIDFDAMSPTTQVLLNLAGITTKPIFEVQ